MPTTSPRTFQAIIFDVDGLIVDTESLYYTAYNQTLQDSGKSIPREGYVPCVGHPVERNSRDAVSRHGLDLAPETFLEAWMDRFETTISNPDQIDLMPGFLDLLAHLRARRYRLGIASSTPRTRMKKTLQNGLLTRLEGVGTLDNIFSTILSGSDVTRTKPDPEIYLLAAQNLQVAPDTCLVFEDSEAGVQAAKAAGMAAFAVPNFFTAHQNHTGADRILKHLGEAIPYP